MSLRFKRLLLFIALSAALVLAQSQTATLRGTVTDSGGTPLAKITLVITDTERDAVVRQVTTGAAGAYEAPYLWPGSYRVAIEESDYRSLVVEGIVLGMGQVRHLDLKLTAGPAAETETVQDAPPAVRTESGAVSDVLDYKSRWHDTPFADLHPSALRLMTTAPAVQGNASGLVISGISSRAQQSWAVDGVPDDISGQTGNPALYETVEVTLANPGVEASRPVGFNMVSKRGTDSLHGQLYYRRGSSAFGARSFFDAAKVPYKLSEAGGELGWALVPGWSHLFGGGMYQKVPFRQTMYADVPTERMRSGDLSQYLNPATAPGGKVVVVKDPRTGSPVSNNVVPANRLSSVAKNYINSYYPAPNLGDANTFTQNYTWTHNFGPDTYIGNWPFVRLDQKISSGHQLYLRWLQNQTAGVAPGSVDRRLSSTQSLRYRSLVFSDVHAFSGRVFNRFTFARVGARAKQGQSEGDVDPIQGDSVVSTLGLQGVNPNGYTAVGFPAVSISGLTGLSMVYGGGLDDNIAHDNNFLSFEDSLTWSLGRHAVRAGLQHTRFSWRRAEVPPTVFGAFTFTGAYTGLAFADFLYGLPATSTRRNVKVGRDLSQEQTGAFLADSFRASSRFTVDYGVRWDYYGTPVYDDGYMTNWDAASGQVIVAPGTITSVSPHYPKSITVVTGDVVPKAKTRNVRPRVSAAYQVAGNLVLRGGYGEFTENLGFGVNGRVNGTDPYVLAETYTNSITGGVAALSFPKPFPTSPSATQFASQSVTALPATDEGVIRQYNVVAEAVARGVALRAAYIGARGAGMNYTLDINKPRAGAAPFSASNRPYPQFANTYVVRTDGRWRYDSVVLRASRRAASLWLDSSVTWANNKSNYLNTTDPYNVTSQWTRDGANRRLYWVTSAVWPLPVGKGRRLLSKTGPLKNFLVGNWDLHAVTTFASGQYYSPLFTGPDPANASPGVVTQLPDCVGDPNAGARTLGRWFNPGAFAAPPAGAGRYGSCVMNMLEGYPIHVGHLGLVKRVPLGEVVKAVFTVQVSNITNTPHFTIPNQNISEPNPGVFMPASVVISSLPGGIGPRRVDFKLRLEW